MRFSIRRTPATTERVVGSPTPAAPVRPWAQRGTRAAVWGAVFLGGVGGLVGLVRPTPAPPTRHQV
ncbi:MAG: hypothetical protein ACRD0U_13240, partial [Acidimicrobiales bacterium]